MPIPSDGYNTATADSVDATPTFLVSGPVVMKRVHSRCLDNSARYLQFYDAATASEVTVNTTPRKVAIGLRARDVAGTVGARIDGGTDESTSIYFENGVVVACTTALTGAPSGPSAAVNCDIEFRPV